MRYLCKHPWLEVCERIAEQQGFFHWELDFAPVFASAVASTFRSETRPGCDLTGKRPRCWLITMCDSP